MNWYPHHIGDYKRDTGHLSMLEDGAYRRLLDTYYGTNANAYANAERLHRVCSAVTDEEKAAVDYVVATFFEIKDGKLHQERADTEIRKWLSKSAKASANARKKWSQMPDARDAKADANADANADASADAKAYASHQPSTINHNNPPNPPCGGNGSGTQIRPKKKKKLSQTEKKRAKVEHNSDLMARIGKWFGRKPSTLWTVYESEALDQCLPVDASDIAIMERYYSADIPAEDNIRRRDLGTLLNNFNTELDRARSFKTPRTPGAKLATQKKTATKAKIDAAIERLKAATTPEQRDSILQDCPQDVFEVAIQWVQRGVDDSLHRTKMAGDSAEDSP